MTDYDEREAKETQRQFQEFARKARTPAQNRKLNVVGCLMFLIVAGLIGLLAVFFINNPNGIPR